MLRGTRTAVLGAIGLTAVVATAVAVAAITPSKPYAVGIAEGYETKPLLTVGDTVPETGNPARQYQMVGIPDGLGAHKGKGRTTVLYMNHELGFDVPSRTTLGEPRDRGAVVSRYILDRDGTPMSGERAYDEVYLENTYVGPAPTEANTTRSFARFCSASLAGKADGFDTEIYFANEESAGASTFDGLGGVAVAIVGNKAHGLPKLGHFAWENTLVKPDKRGRKQVVLVGMEDGPSDLAVANSNSQVYLYVGTKERGSSSVLSRNGLDNGKLYVLAPVNPAFSSEETFTSGSIDVKWVQVPNANTTTDVQLEAASDAAGAFRFARPEDGAFNKENSDHYVFVTTGGSTSPATANALGRIYSLEFDEDDPLRPARLTVEVNADQVLAAGGDTAISPDNIDTSEDYLMVNEDGTTQSRAAMTSKNRDGSIWRFRMGESRVRGASATRVAALTGSLGGRNDNLPVTAGIWETTGIIDASAFFGDDAWLFNVQAHPPTTSPPDTVEDGQLLLLTRDD